MPPAMADPVAPAIRAIRPNQVLAALPRRERQQFERDLEPVPLTLGQQLHARGARIDHAYFPETAVCSLITVMADGEAAESGTVGFEGLVGVELALGVTLASCDAVVQVPGLARRMPIDVFADHLARSVELREMVHRSINALLAQSLQSAACNRLHALMQRCCRWLLLTHDRAGADEFRLTHDLLAIMIGVRRPSATLALGELEAAGIMAIGRGRLRVLDRAGLEARACECYAAMRHHLLRVGGSGVG